LYPFPETELKAELAKYPNLTQVVWTQEEPKNQGAWYPSAHHIHACLEPKMTLLYAGREASASPAVGYITLHNRQQAALLEAAIG
jgi:2-oxoglutarate dehydrogenase E1 component